MSCPVWTTIPMRSLKVHEELDPNPTTSPCTSLPPPPPHHGSLDVLLLTGLGVLLLASPGLECRGLEGPAVGEGEGPGPVQGTLVDGAQVDRGLFLTLAT